MSFESFYGSFVQQPLLLWGAAAVGLAVSAAPGRAAPSVRVFCVAFGIVSFLDAWLTADDVAGVGTLGATAGVVAGSFFAVVGDLRVFLFLDGATPQGDIALDRRRVLRAIAWALVVPAAAAAVHAVLPDTPWRSRATFLFYEASFLVLLAVRARVAPSRAAVWSRRVTGFVELYYALWALADATILGFGLDVGFLMRVVANVLYYGGLVAFVRASAPEERAP